MGPQRGLGGEASGRRLREEAAGMVRPGPGPWGVGPGGLLGGYVHVAPHPAGFSLAWSHSSLIAHGQPPAYRHHQGLFIKVLE